MQRIFETVTPVSANFTNCLRLLDHFVGLAFKALKKANLRSF